MFLLTKIGNLIPYHLRITNVQHQFNWILAVRFDDFFEHYVLGVLGHVGLLDVCVEKSFFILMLCYECQFCNHREIGTSNFLNRPLILSIHRESVTMMDKSYEVVRVV